MPGALGSQAGAAATTTVHVLCSPRDFTPFLRSAWRVLMLSFELTGTGRGHGGIAQAEV